MTKKTNLSNIDTRDKILQEAGKLFVSRGYHGVSMREVASAVGVTKPALYHHYADKESLFVAILEDSLSDLTTIINTVEAENDFKAKLYKLTDLLISKQPDHWIGLQLSNELKHISQENRQNFENEYRKVWLGGIGKIIAEAIKKHELRTDLPPQDISIALLGVLYPLVSSPLRGDKRAIANNLLTVFFEGASQK